MTQLEIRAALHRLQKLQMKMRTWRHFRKGSAPADEVEANEIAAAEVRAQAETYRRALRIGRAP